MRSWVFCISAGVLAGVANAACTNKCGSQKCLGAIAADPAVGESFCSSWLALEPATTTVTEIETVTSTLVSVETALTTLTVTAETVTVTGTDRSTVFQKRAPTISTEADPASTPGPAEAIVSQCSNNDDRISKACSCILSTATASTVTVFETAVSTAVVEAQSTVVETVTSNVVATVSVPAPAVTIPANVIVNGGFENYLTTGNILPWTDTRVSTGGRVEIVNGVNPCASATDCAGGRIIIRAYPPNAGGGYVAVRETFDGRPSTTYAVSFLYRCLNFDANTSIQVLYNGVVVGTASNCVNSAAFFRPTGIQFTTDSTGRGELEIRFRNPSNQPYLYFYADDFKAIAV
ncbi:hypothetical protein B0T21DRAFT_310036 [Apiosordaria backusii]|uniref:Uncharacterized protein n=1 Tax=Apiosordaria backusii TaxID=314023 RepID=A0AA40BMZ2_9PEZI|nr:hypothetical protein B0T21DRAFT_310036 [Apiosordaria backusii]